MLRRRTKSIEKGLHSAMLAKTLPLLLLGACASTAQLPTADQPELAQMAQSYAQQLQAIGAIRSGRRPPPSRARFGTGRG
jgi:hypothetical protein